MSNSEDKEKEKTEKKTWISPDMHEIQVDGGGTGVFESASLKAS